MNKKIFEIACAEAKKKGENPDAYDVSTVEESRHIQDVDSTTAWNFHSKQRLIYPRSHRHQCSAVGIAMLRGKDMLWQEYRKT